MSYRILYSKNRPSRFDQLLLSLLDSIEQEAGDIDAKLETLRVYLLQEKFVYRTWDHLRLRAAWLLGIYCLDWQAATPARTQLKRNWNRLARGMGQGVDYIFGDYGDSSDEMASAWHMPQGQTPTALVPGA
jgi:hypothetical protein